MVEVEVEVTVVEESLVYTCGTTMLYRFKRAEGIPRVEEVQGWKLVKLLGVVGSKGK
jgi:hypothetical protein